MRGTADCPQLSSNCQSALRDVLQELVASPPSQSTSQHSNKPLLASKLSPRLFLYAVELEKELHYISLKLNQVMRKLH